MTIKFSKDHEWINAADANASVVGITVHAQDALGDVVFVDLPEVGAAIDAKAVAGVVESVKGAHDIFAPVSGTVAEVNGDLEDAPQKVNEDPYGSWIAVIDMSRPDELKGLMDAAAYAAHCENAPAH